MGAEWLRNFATPDIVRHGSGVDAQLGVVGVPRTEGFRPRESRREVACNDAIHSKQQAETVMKALSEHGASARSPAVKKQ